MVVCVLCRQRKGKRFCPVVYNVICPTCCGTHRLKKLNCPSSCPYLRQAKALEMAQREAEWAQKSSERAEIEQRLTAFALEEAISTFATEHPDLTDAEAISALQAVQDAIEREVMSGITHEPNVDGRAKELALRILKNAQTMRQRIGIPHNVLLARVARLLTQRAMLLSQRTRDGQGYLRTVRIDVPPNSLEQLLERLTSSARS
ncbi:hypothetical protein Q2T83_11085 [Fervidibacter sacchari]|uniref:Uncharacterized protein n=1 Tax=Candidatus Fervidibacter sacchari TaxID=1448929 RepID=A0ABT2ESI8_9BACT|nr:hypothetical protein [Candidatus Fervidibacter sacchari]MCS3920933.1 hypothetical protein [Candidatus Fervidibacter sacchari]WKU14879.1 hypothetical protein Q2T83_11085 [Candidatus Fervidibacter sacchari]